MNPFAKQPVKGLYHWLEIATERLAAPAKERVRGEIEAHYAEAVAVHVAEGLTESDAKMAAIAELGDAKVAARRFRREHLTERQAGMVEEALKSARSGSSLLFNYMMFGALSFPYWILRVQGRLPAFCMAIAFLTLVILSTFAFLAMKRKGARPSGFLLYCWSSLGIGVWGFSGTVISAYMPDAPVWAHAYVIPCLLLFFVLVLSYLRIWYKLRNNKDEWRDVLSHDGPCSLDKPLFSGLLSPRKRTRGRK